ncbi:MAG: nitroreductase family protein [Candidatus Omnitrophica bacterium]|nr:nitroreductase family protein [Candidatus Omnitrophota bacterium]
MNKVIETILTRRSIRKFTGEPVDLKDLEAMVKAGMSAPTSRDTRHFRFVIVNDLAVVKKLADSLPYAKMLLTSRHAIVVASDFSVAHGGTLTDYWAQDCSAAAENVLLAAHALGYGACWTAAHPRPERVAIVKEILGLPESVMPLCVIAVGKPTGEEKPRDKFNPEHVFLNRWDEKG